MPKRNYKRNSNKPKKNLFIHLSKLVAMQKRNLSKIPFLYSKIKLNLPKTTVRKKHLSNLFM